MASTVRFALLLLLSVAFAAQASGDPLLQQSEEKTAVASARDGSVLQRAKRFIRLGGGLSHQLNAGAELAIGKHPWHGPPGYGYPPPPPPVPYYGYNSQPYNYGYQPSGHNYNYPLYYAAPAISHSQSSGQSSALGSGTRSYSSSQSAAQGYGK